MKAIILSVVLYGCETSTPSRKEEYATADWKSEKIRQN
jgi:hypothetical protein